MFDRAKSGGNFTRRSSTTSPSSTEPKNCGVRAALLATDFTNGLRHAQLKEKYSLYQYESKSYVPALVRTSKAFDPKILSDLKVRTNTKAGDIYSLHIPLENYTNLLSDENIEYIELSVPVYPRLDEALAASKVDLVHQGVNLSQSFSGQGVVVGIIDFGFDYTQPTFHDPTTGASRIKRTWEQNNPFGTSPDGFSYGSEFSDEEEIFNEKTDLIQSGHGSHVASIAAGSGGSSPEKYRGIAYESDIVLISLNAGDGIRGNTSGIMDGINYIFQYAESVGKPAVINISHGHHMGPHDGTSLSDQMIDAMSGPGRIIVGAAGNEGDASGFFFHFSNNFNVEKEVLSYLLWQNGLSAGATIVDIWGEEGADLQVGLEIYNPQTKTREDASELLQSDQPVSFVSGQLIDLEGDTLHFQGGVEISALNNRPHAQFFVDNTAQETNNDVNWDNELDNDFVLLRFKSDRGTVHAYSANNAGETFFADLVAIGGDSSIDGIRPLGGNPTSTIGELGGTAKSIICVGGYMTKNQFNNILGQQITFEDELDDLYFRSSQGPTHDGRMKPDITAPAGFIAAAGNSYYPDFNDQFIVENLDRGDGTSWRFGMRRGTSMSAPHVAGIVALMLEANPNLTPEEVRQVLTTTAEQDDFTGSVPNNLWGFGKVNAHQAIASLEMSTSTTFPSEPEELFVYPNPTSGSFTLISESKNERELRVIDYSGKVIIRRVLETNAENHRVQLPGSAQGLYYVEVKSGKEIWRQKLVVIE